MEGTVAPGSRRAGVVCVDVPDIDHDEMGT